MDTLPSDEELLVRVFARLKSSGRIEYTGEYGDEVAAFIPLVSWLKQEGYLNGCRIVTYRGMRPYYFFLEEDQLVEKDEPRRWIPRREREWPTNDACFATLQPWLLPPDYRRHYAPSARVFARPTLFIQNKFAVEWNRGPINYLPLLDLRLLLTIARDRFQVVYSRPGAMRPSDDYSHDHNDFCQYPDLALIDQFPEVLVLESMARQEGRPYNEVKLEVLAGAHLFCAVQGGGAHVLAAFGDSLLAILHRRGAETRIAYERGPYTYLSPVPPTLIVARDDDQLTKAVRTFERVKVRPRRGSQG
jgi:hypothetical protein